jgi:hypothetical protein
MFHDNSGVDMSHLAPGQPRPVDVQQPTGAEEPRNNMYTRSASSRKIISILIQASDSRTDSSLPGFQILDFGHFWKAAAVTSSVQFDN